MNPPCIDRKRLLHSCLQSPDSRCYEDKVHSLCSIHGIVLDLVNYVQLLVVEPSRSCDCAGRCPDSSLIVYHKQTPPLPQFQSDLQRILSHRMSEIADIELPGKIYW